MAYASWSVTFGEQPSAAKWNILGTNDASFNDGSGIHNLTIGATTSVALSYKFSVYRNAAQSLTSATPTKVNFDTKLYDTGSNFDNVTNFRFVAPIAGFYQFNAAVLISQATPASTDDGIVLRVNGSNKHRGTNLVGVSYPGLTVSAEIQLAASDYVEVFVLHAPANTPALFVGSSEFCWFQGYLLAKT